MDVEECLVGLAQVRVVPVQDLEQGDLYQVGLEDLDQVGQEELDQLDLEALELVQEELVLVDMDQEVLVQVFTFTWKPTYKTGSLHESFLLCHNGSVGSLFSVNIFHRVHLNQQGKEYMSLFHFLIPSRI